MLQVRGARARVERVAGARFHEEKAPPGAERAERALRRARAYVQFLGHPRLDGLGGGPFSRAQVWCYRRLPTAAPWLAPLVLLAALALCYAAARSARGGHRPRRPAARSGELPRPALDRAARRDRARHAARGAREPRRRLGDRAALSAGADPPGAQPAPACSSSSCWRSACASRPSRSTRRATRRPTARRSTRPPTRTGRARSPPATGSATRSSSRSRSTPTSCRPAYAAAGTDDPPRGGTSRERRKPCSAPSRRCSWRCSPPGSSTAARGSSPASCGPSTGRPSG